MNVFYKATLESLKKNRVRTLVTILGVVLSAAMVCAVTTIVVSFQGFYRDDAVYQSGDWYGMVPQADGVLKETLAQDGRVSQVASAQILGYAESESRNEDKPYIYLLGADETFFSSMPVHYTGRLPRNPGEVLVPEHYLAVSNGGAKVKLGDTLTLSLGDRTSEGYSLSQDNPYTEGETLEIRTTASYTVVGFYERPDFEDYSAPGYTFLTLPEGDGPRSYTLYYKTADPADTEQVIADYDLPNEQNWSLLAAEGVFRYDNFGQVMIDFATILIVLIVLGSVSLIYSAFSISVSERTKQFGLLRSVGATRKQLRKSVFFEAAVISAIGIPLGIAGGIGGMAVTLYFLGDKFGSLVSSEVPMRLRVSWISVGVTALISVLTVGISVWIPAKRATRVTAMEAIRQSKEIRSKGEDVKVSRLTRKLFGLEGVLAKKYYRRGRSRYRATVVSLALSIVLFITASSFCMYLTDTVEETVTVSNYDVRCYLEEIEPAEAFPKLLEAQGVTGGTYLLTSYQVILVEPEQLDEGCLDFLCKEGSARFSPELLKQDAPIALGVYTYYVDDDAYGAFLARQGLDAAEYLDAEQPRPLVYNQSYGVSYEQNGDTFNRTTSTYSILKPSVTEVQLRQDQELEGYLYSYTDNWERDPVTGEEIPRTAVDYYWSPETGEEIQIPAKAEPFPLGAYITELPMGVTQDPNSCCIFLYPYSARPDGSQGAMACFTSSDHKSTAGDLERILLEEGYYSGGTQVYDLDDEEATYRSLIVIINVFSYGFIGLISLISAANVFNTISTNVALRRREFAMLRSVGMTRRGLNRMMGYECLLYGFRALAFGLPLAGLMTVWIYKTSGGAVQGGYRLPWGAIAVAVCSVFAVVFVTMLYAMRKIKRENPIDALKNENT